MLMIVPIVLMIVPYASSNGAPVSILTPTPSLSAIPDLVVAGSQTTLTIEASPSAPHQGSQIAVWNPTANPLFISGCSLPDEAGGTKWELRADTDNDNDFTDLGGFAVVGYSLPSSGDSISFEFGDGGKVTIALTGGATVTPSSPSGGYAWQDVSLTGAGTYGTDNTSSLGEYKFASCGEEGEVGFEEPFLGTTTFIVTECIESPEQPDDPISMNSVRSGDKVKTIHAEKQIFDCSLEQGDIPVIVDVTIFAEIYEDMSTQSVIHKQVEVVTCTKHEETATVIRCKSTIASEDPQIPVQNCNEEPINHPQEMNTVNKGNIVKTIESQKEVFLCNLGSGVLKKVDLVVFTEIWEDLTKLNQIAPQDPVIKTTFESLRCVVLAGTATVESCQFSQIPN